MFILVIVFIVIIYLFFTGFFAEASFGYIGFYGYFGLPLIIIFLMTGTKIIIKGNEIDYVSHYVSKKKILISNIKEIKIESGLRHVEGQSLKVLFLNLYDSDSFSKKPFSVGLRVFPEDDLRVLINYIEKKNPSVIKDSYVIDLMNKKFNPTKLILG